MIELPEANVLATQITQALQGKVIRSAVANQSPHKFAWYNLDPAAYTEILPGKAIGTASASGNHVEIQAGERILLISTPIRYHPQGEPPPKKHQLLLEFKDGSALSCTVQMWGVLMCLEPGELPNLPDYLYAKRKPSPLSDAFDQAYFESLLNDETRRLSAKAFLATDQRIPGLGNGVLQDILWAAKVHPRQVMADLPEPQVEALFAVVKSLLAEMTLRGGRDTERDLFGCPGGYRTVLSKNTVGSPCPECGSTILKEAYLGGSIYFCPGCQPLG